MSRTRGGTTIRLTDAAAIFACPVRTKEHRRHVLSVTNLPAEVIDGTIRVSLSRQTTQEEIYTLLSTPTAMILTFRLRDEKF